MIVRKTIEMSLINIKNSKQGRQKHLPRLMGPHMGGYSWLIDDFKKEQ